MNSVEMSRLLKSAIEQLELHNITNRGTTNRIHLDKALDLIGRTIYGLEKPSIEELREMKLRDDVERLKQDLQERGNFLRY